MLRIRLYNCQCRYKVAGPNSLPEGPVTIRVEFVSDGGVGKGGNVTLFVTNNKVPEGPVDNTVPSRFSADETFDIGMDTGECIRGVVTAADRRARRCSDEQAVLSAAESGLVEQDLQALRV